MKNSPLALLRAASCMAACLVSAINAVGSGVEVIEKDGQVSVTWPISADEIGSAVFNMDEAKPLIESLGVAAKGREMRTIASGLTPVTLLTVGSRDLASPAGWVAFFDNPPKRPHETFPVKLGKRALHVSEEGSHTTVSLAEASAGSFHGELRFTFYRNSSLMKAETVMATEEDGRAIVYDTGLAGAKPDWKAVVWNDPAGKFQRVTLDQNFAAAPVAVQGRTIVAESSGGSLAVFPAPHRFFYPQDEAFNLKFVWHGKDYGGTNSGTGIGIRQSLEGDTRFVPWFNAPPKTKQELGAFYLISSGDGKQTLDTVARSLSAAARLQDIHQPLSRRAHARIPAETEGGKSPRRAGRVGDSRHGENLQGARREHRPPRGVSHRRHAENEGHATATAAQDLARRVRASIR